MTSFGPICCTQKLWEENDRPLISLSVEGWGNLLLSLCLNHLVYSCSKSCKFRLHVGMQRRLGLQKQTSQVLNHTLSPQAATWGFELPNTQQRHWHSVWETWQWQAPAPTRPTYLRLLPSTDQRCPVQEWSTDECVLVTSISSLSAEKTFSLWIFSKSSSLVLLLLAIGIGAVSDSKSTFMDRHWVILYHIGMNIILLVEVEKI